MKTIKTLVAAAAALLMATASLWAQEARPTVKILEINPTDEIIKGTVGTP